MFKKIKQALKSLANEALRKKQAPVVEQTFSQNKANSPEYMRDPNLSCVVKGVLWSLEHEKTLWKFRNPRTFDYDIVECHSLEFWLSTKTDYISFDSNLITTGISSHEKQILSDRLKEFVKKAKLEIESKERQRAEERLSRFKSIGCPTTDNK